MMAHGWRLAWRARLWALVGLTALASGCQPARVQAPAPVPAPAPEPAPEPVAIEPARTAPTGPPQIALLTPLTGDASAIGGDLLDAAQLALFAVGPTDAVLRPRDTGGTVEGAKAAARAAIAEGAELVVGPLFGRSAAAIRPILEDAGVKALAFTNVAANVGDPVWGLGFRPSEQFARVAGYAARRGAEIVSVIGPDDAYGAAGLEGARTAIARGAPLRLGPTAFYEPGSGDPSPEVRRITDWDGRVARLEAERESLALSSDEQAAQELARLESAESAGLPPFDALMIADGGLGLRAVASSLEFYGVEPSNARILGSMRWLDDPAALRLSGLQGAWLAAPSPDEIDQFTREFESAFDRRPVAKELTALAYDAVALAVVLSRRDRLYRTETLTDPNGFSGRSGAFRLTSDGVAEHALSILEVRNGGAIEIEPAPLRFDDALVN